VTPSLHTCHCRAIIYLNIHVLRGQHRIIRLLEEQIANVCELRVL